MNAPIYLGENDDLADTTAQAVQHLRDRSFIGSSQDTYQLFEDDELGPVRPSGRLLMSQFQRTDRGAGDASLDPEDDLEIEVELDGEEGDGEQEFMLVDGELVPVPEGGIADIGEPGWNDNLAGIH